MVKGGRSKGSETILRAWRALGTRHVFYGFVFFVLTTLILSANFLPERVNVKVGEVINRQIKAPQGTVYVSEVLTEKERRQAANRVDPIFKIDQLVVQEIEQGIGGYFEEISKIKNDEEMTDEEKDVQLKEKTGLDLDLATLAVVRETDLASLNSYENELKKIVRDNMRKGIQQEAIDSTLQSILMSINSADIQEDIKPLLQIIIKDIKLRPNLVPDIEGTEQRKAEAIEKVEPVQVTIRQGEKILGDGEVVTEEKIEALQHLGILRTHFMFFSVIGLAGLVLASYLLIFLYLYRYNREIIYNEKKFILLGLLIIVGLLLDKGIVSINLGGNSEISSIVGFMVPTAAVSMLIAVLLDRRLALFVTAILSVFVGVLLGSQLQYSIVSFIGGTAGVYSVSKISERTDLTRASVYIVMANIIAILSVILINTNSMRVISFGVVIGIINGVLSSVLTIGALPFLENAFEITTNVKLLELSNPNQPLLKRLLLEAPGTYHHSVMVANLAEGAADAIGADPLLARVGAYYHDIGKLKRPYFFIENQLASKNPHDKLSPNLSTLIIIAHVKDGIELAKEHNLPQPVMEMIDQHHGTGLVAYFYHKALESEYGETTNEIDYRYPGPKPKTKEAAIVMLADSVEATVRSLQFTGHGRLEACVRKMIKDRLEDGQLEESELTFKELEDITQVFVRVLNGIFHSRIEYPENVIREIEGSKDLGNNDKQQPAED
ncbi:MAG: HDIG domain-containing protein [Clostridia bacterium]|nr:HDIG domain-containing protein [Clostridia bacterium]